MSEPRVYNFSVLSPLALSADLLEAVTGRASVAMDGVVLPVPFLVGRHVSGIESFTWSDHRRKTGDSSFFVVQDACAMSAPGLG